MYACFALAVLLAYLLHVFHKPYLRLFRPTGEKYLTRWKFANNRLFRIYLHRLDGPDPDRHLHNHPWDGLVILLRGKYVQRVIQLKQNEPGHPVRECWNQRVDFVKWINHLGAEYHKIVTIRPGTWTLVFAGPVRREWGFLVEGQHVQWETYVEKYQAGVLNAEGTVSGRKL